MFLHDLPLLPGGGVPGEPAAIMAPTPALVGSLADLSSVARPSRLRILLHLMFPHDLPLLLGGVGGGVPGEPVTAPAPPVTAPTLVVPPPAIEAADGKLSGPKVD